MLPFTNLLKLKMKRTAHLHLMLSVFVLFALLNTIAAEPKPRTPARILAKQTGATQFEEERYEVNPDCNDHKHHLKKRASDEDVDYEVYQGVVGRPGIDFPIYPRIPKTSFSCRTYGNGYFADMETECQVFHICEDGRKISFLCPNGTIFQQSELTCDWWFKVNCLGSSGYYAESAEILNKQRVQRIRPPVPVHGFNIVGGGLNLKPKINSKALNQERRSSKSSERRIDSNEEVAPVESIDFDDVSSEKNFKGSPKSVITNIETNNEHQNNEESQITAESGSFVTDKRRNGFNDHDHQYHQHQQKPKDHSRNYNKNSQRQGVDDKEEKARSGYRGRQRYHEDKKPSAESIEQPSDTEESHESRESIRKVLPEKYISKPNQKTSETNDKFNQKSFKSAGPTSSTPYYSVGTYSTAKRFDTTRSTPYYTPTVPSLTKSKATEGKNSYVKTGKSATVGFGTTPNPNQLINVQPQGFEGLSKGNKNLSGSSTSTLNIDDALPTTTILPSTGPTYLPKTSQNINTDFDSNGSNLLFAPSPALNESVSRNVNEMLKTISIIKTTLNTNENSNDSNNHDTNELKFKSQSREGLEIPPSSGPDALVSLAKYFATESNASNENQKQVKEEKPTASEKTRAGVELALGLNVLKPSDSTATITTTASPSIAANADDIQASLLSDKIVSKYTNLFGLSENKDTLEMGNLDEGLSSNTKTKEESSNDNYHPFPQIGTTDTTISTLSTTPESRKIAQVFSNALNTYLEDPESFRAQLASVRPTEPPVRSFDKNQNNDDVANSNNNNDFKSDSAASYLPTEATTLAYETTTATSIAVEINSNFDFATTNTGDFTGATESYDSTTFKPQINYKSKQQQLENLQLELADALLPPSLDSNEGDEILQREHSQSFVNSRNYIDNNSEKDMKMLTSTTTTTTSTTTTTTEKPSTTTTTTTTTTRKPSTTKSSPRARSTTTTTTTTENPWAHISQADFLDPLTINDGLMKDQGSTTTTFSPFTYLPKEATTTSAPSTQYKDNDQGYYSVLNEAAQRSTYSNSNLELSSRLALNNNNNNHNNYASNSDGNKPSDNWQDILSSYDIPHDALPSSSGLQRIANKLFGGLNENEALHLKNVMAQAEHNRQVLSLLLLLIQTCDDQNGRALERSRKHLLNALIDMDSKTANGRQELKKNTQFQTTTTRIPVTTYKRYNDDYLTSTIAYPTSTNSPEVASTTMPTAPTTSFTSNGDETTKFEIHVPDIEDEQSFDSSSSSSSTASKTSKIESKLSSNSNSNANSTGSSDKRALELLKSLYSLASKFTSRR